jgi:hypothetical protein
MMDALVGVGGLRVRPEGGFDFWLPAYMLLTFLLVRRVVGMRLSPTTGVVAFAGGTFWAWSAHGLGILPAAALAVLLAIVAGGIRRRRGWERIPPH